jgi:hypothetical protein
MNKPLLHLDRLSQADLGKFSVLLSQILTNRQRASLNLNLPDVMAQIGAFDGPKSPIPQPVGLGSNPNAVPVGQKPREVTSRDIEAFRSMIRNNRKIEAIKECRMICGVGLKEAKDYIDAIAAKLSTDSGPSNQQY